MNSLNTFKIVIQLNYIRKSTSSLIENELVFHYKTSLFWCLGKARSFFVRNPGNHKYAVRENAEFLNIKSDGTYDYHWALKGLK